MKFSDIPGSVYLKQVLIDSVEKDRIAHALLFSGPSGSASFALALAYTSYIFCENKTDADACGNCPSCSKTFKMIHPDVGFIFPTAVTKKIPKTPLSKDFIVDWRSFILESPYAGPSEWVEYIEAENKQLNIPAEESRQMIQSLALKSFEGKKKIILIRFPEFMHPAASNALLKVLEEPTPETCIFLVTENEEKILPTILSRTQRIRVPAFDAKDIATLLRRKGLEDDEVVQKITFLSEGNANTAFTLSQDTVPEQGSAFRDWMRLCYIGDFAMLIDMSEKYHMKSKEAQKNFLTYGLSVLREAMLAKYAQGELMRAEGELKTFTENFSRTVSDEALTEITNLINQALYHIERNAHAKIIFFDTSLLIRDALKNQQRERRSA